MLNIQETLMDLGISRRQMALALRLIERAEGFEEFEAQWDRKFRVGAADKVWAFCRDVRAELPTLFC